MKTADQISLLEAINIIETNDQIKQIRIERIKRRQSYSQQYSARMRMTFKLKKEKMLNNLKKNKNDKRKNKEN